MCLPALLQKENIDLLFNEKSEIKGLLLFRTMLSLKKPILISFAVISKQFEEVV
jgi:hypothetical protein